MCVYNTWTAMSSYEKARPFDHHQVIINFNYAPTSLEDVAFAIPIQIRANIWMSNNF